MKIKKIKIIIQENNIIKKYQYIMTVQERKIIRFIIQYIRTSRSRVLVNR
jgi:hypothetical protein